VTVHHGGDTDGADGGQSLSEALLDLGGEARIRRDETTVDGVERVRPEAVRERVLPLVSADRNRLTGERRQAGLDASRAELDAERGLAGADDATRVIGWHLRHCGLHSSSVSLQC